MRSGRALLFFGSTAQRGKLGAGIASARLQPNLKLFVRQALLKQRIELFNELFVDSGPQLRASESPVRFIEVGAEERAWRSGVSLRRRVLPESIGLSGGSRRRAWIRIMLTTHRTENDLVCLARALGSAGSGGGNRISEIR